MNPYSVFDARDVLLWTGLAPTADDAGRVAEDLTGAYAARIEPLPTSTTEPAVETTYDRARPSMSRLKHKYGANVHILSDPWAMSLLARLGHPACDTRDAQPLLDACTQILLQAASEQLPHRHAVLPTRMTPGEPRALVHGTLLDPRAHAIIADVARGGILPSMHFQRGLMQVLHPDRVRVDHIYLQRTSDPDTGAVVGVDHAGSKIGGPAEGATVFVPDPMAATGSSMAYVLDLYRNLPPGPPHKIVACHLIVTPEYLARIARSSPDVTVYALRLDRGLSSPEALATVPGTLWAQERGLDDHSYIVPGAGGIGEVLNNAWL